MCISLIQGNIKTAFYYNQVIFCMLPLIFYFIGVSVFRYVKYGKFYEKFYEKIILYILIAVLILYGIVRNTFLYPFY